MTMPCPVRRLLDAVRSVLTHEWDTYATYNADGEHKERCVRCGKVRWVKE